MKKAYTASEYEMDFFFDEDFNLIHQWDCNDAMYRDEYMKGLFEKLGINMEGIDANDERVKSTIETYLKDIGLGDMLDW